MRVIGHIIMLLALLCLMTLQAEAQTQVLVPSSGRSTMHLQPGETITVLDPGGTDNYPGNCSGTLDIISAAGTALHISGHVTMAVPGHDYLSMSFDNYTSGYVYHYFGGDYIDTTIGSGIVDFKFVSFGGSSGEGFELTVHAMPIENSTIFNIRVDEVSNNRAHIVWQDTSSANLWVVRYGLVPSALGGFASSLDREINLTGLLPHKVYFFRVYNGTSYSMPDTIERTLSFVTGSRNPTSDCIRYDDLNFGGVVCKYGSFNIPESNTGAVDSGEYDSRSRHTVCTDTSHYDQNTGGLLRCVPPGMASSVRLGNWNGGAEAETITYEYYVDTSVTPLLLMRYAVVMQQPGHARNEQPRFQLDVNDVYGLPVNTNCYSIDFVANQSLNWNQRNNGTIWKDWTSLGIDLSSMHGQSIFIKLSTYDCAQGAHYGYAYFALACEQKTVEYSNCGFSDSNIFTAPEGFSYRWYNVDAPGITLSVNRSLQVDTAGQYNCILGFVGQDSTIQCSFEMEAYAGAVFPYARFAWRKEATSRCDVYVRLLNRSVITLDPNHVLVTESPVEAEQWLFDDSLLDGNNPVVLCSPGLHHVSLRVSIADGQCVDSVEADIMIPNPCSDSVWAVICEGESYTLYDTIVYETGIYEADSGQYHRTLFLTVRPAIADNVTIQVTDDDLPFTYAGVQFEDTVTNYQFSYVDSYGCDSIIIFNLKYWPDYWIRVDTSVCDSELPISVCDTLLRSGGVCFLHYTGQHGEDSTIEIHLKVLPRIDEYQYVAICKGDTYRWIDGVEYDSPTDSPVLHFTSSYGCDSLVHLVLEIDRNLSAEMSIRPEIADYENNVVTLSDVSKGSYCREWYYLDTRDTSRQCQFVYLAENDTVDVVLVVHSHAGCNDTAYGLVRFDRSALWAPNAFIPNEAINNCFKIATAGVVEGEVSVYNRQGAHVATFDLLDGWWDGTYKGKRCAQGAYVWIATYTTEANPRIEHHAKGTVLLID